MQVFPGTKLHFMGGIDVTIVLEKNMLGILINPNATSKKLWAFELIVSFNGPGFTISFGDKTR